MIIAYFKKKHKKRLDERRRKYEEIEKREMMDRYNRNFHWILENFSEDLQELAANGQSFSSLEFVRPMEFADCDLGGTFEQAARDIGFILDLAEDGKSSAYIICQRLTVPLPEKGKPKSIAQMMIWGNK